MYDAKMMQMLNLIHLENQQIFELVRASTLSEESRKKVTFDAYDEEYKRIMKKLEKHSPCVDCSYKNRFEKAKRYF